MNIHWPIKEWRRIIAAVIASAITIVILSYFLKSQSSIESSLSNSLNEYVHALNETFENQQISGCILVTKQGEIASMNFYGMADYQNQFSFSQDTRFLLCSTTKMFTAIGIMQLHEKGLLKLDSSIAQYYPNQSWEETITIRQLLTHTSGLLRDLTDIGQIDPYEQTEKKRLLNLIQQSPLLFKPGTDMAYSNVGYHLLAGIIEQVSNLSYEKYMEKHIFKPVKMRDTSCATEVADIEKLAIGNEYKHGRFHGIKPYNLSHAFGSGNIISTPYDMALFDKALMTNQLIKAETLAQITVDNTGLSKDYGYGCFVGTLYGVDWFGHPGNFSNGYFSYYIRFPQEGVGIILLFNTVWNDNNSIMKAVSAIALKKPYTLLQNRERVSTAKIDFSRYEGVYKSSDGQAITVKTADGLLLATIGTGAYLTAYDEDSFYDTYNEFWEFIFITDQNDKVIGCTISNGFDTIWLEKENK